MTRPQPIIVTPRLILRPPHRADIDIIVATIGDRDVATMVAPVPLPYRHADAESFLAIARSTAASGRALHFIIERFGRPIGGIAIGDIPRTCEFGYWLGRADWGHGFATEAGRALLAYGFAVLRLRLIRSGVFVDNPASMRVQTKLGFRAIGRSGRMSLARGVTVEHIDTVLTRAGFEALLR